MFGHKKCSLGYEHLTLVQISCLKQLQEMTVYAFTDGLSSLRHWHVMHGSLESAQCVDSKI